MTTLEVTLDLPDRLAREALAAGLLTPKALREMVKDAMHRRAAEALLAGAQHASASGSKPLSMNEIQAEVSSVRRERKTKDAKAARSQGPAGWSIPTYWFRPSCGGERRHV